MRKNISTILLGLLLILAGIGYGGNAMDLWHFELFFDGWWTLFIIVPCAMSIIDHGFDTGNTIGLGVGIMLLLSSLDILNYHITMRLLFPLVLIALGLSLLLRPRRNRAEITQAVSSLSGQDVPEITACFSSDTRHIANEITGGARLTAVFGSLTIDLRDAVITKDILLECSAVFGGIDLLLPAGVTVKCDTFNLFGGTDNRFKTVTAQGPTVYLTGSAVFGGIEVK